MGALIQVPHQSMRDALVTMITVQGDTEFASVEQQRHLLATAPTDYDRYAAARSWLKNNATAGKWLTSS